MVDSAEKAEQLCAQGQLERVLLTPAEFGGPDHPQNVVYCPLGSTESKAGVDLNIIAPLIQEGRVQAYAAMPKYEGNSFVPIALEITAWHPESPDAGVFAATLAMWGSALTAGPAIADGGQLP
ncbi:hypothetical protein FR943_22125 [Mycobacterium sp. TNTM28]|uniref:Uncharacterized protein n=1 Tax=[Mycobacterium] fortunisiensis TaxID=2600579 RepID=A0ABS6KS96_9MYCO|nr:hypothetical protein [[Mycobacterium] fortunisiensis]MBU9766527.1 hypothetical protein [[Mycobacterium] fortunisiensis]